MMALPRAPTYFIFTQHAWIISADFGMMLMKPVRETRMQFRLSTQVIGQYQNRRTL